LKAPVDWKSLQSDVSRHVKGIDIGSFAAAGWKTTTTAKAIVVLAAGLVGPPVVFHHLD
jgi:hypothetical protein